MLEKTPECPLDCKEIQPVNPKGNQPWIFIGRTETEAEAPILWPPDVKNWLIGKDPDAGRDWRQEEKGMTEDEMAGWHHRLDPGVGDGQGGLACCSPWGRKESDTTEWLNWTELRDSKEAVMVLLKNWFCLLNWTLFFQHPPSVLLFSQYVVSVSLQPHGLQHAVLLCSPLPPGVCSNSYPLSWWRYWTISSFATPFSFCLQSFPVSGSFPMSQLLASGGQSIAALASASVLPINIQDWFPLELNGLNCVHLFLISKLVYTSYPGLLPKHSSDLMSLGWMQILYVSLLAARTTGWFLSFLEAI